MDVKVGKNKYQITLPIVLTLGAIIVSAISIIIFSILKLWYQ